MKRYSDARDQALADVTPVVAAPTYGELSPVGVDSYRYVLASNGLFIEARTRALFVRAKLTDTVGAPYGCLKSSVQLAGGVMPAHLGQKMIQAAREAAPNEWAAAVVFDHDLEDYRLVNPRVKSKSHSHIQYESIQETHKSTLVVDIHSHGHMDAFFSSTDDADDQDGIYIAVVVGFPQKTSGPRFACRIVIYGHHVMVPWLPWEDCNGS